MQKNIVGISGILAYAGMLTFTAAHAELVRNPTAVGANFDMGQIVRGNLNNIAGNGNGPVSDQMITRTGVYVTESGTYDQRFSVQLTIGGLFWYGLPEGTSFAQRLIQFGPGVGQAQAQYVFGDLKDPIAKLQFGLFPVKYNPDAKDLGEYLFRSTSYPTALMTGGWSYLDAASYLAQGAKVSFPMFQGKLTHDFTLFMERDIEPTGDLDPGYMVTYKPVSSVELGGGVVWAHGIPLKDEKDFRNADWAYNTKTGKPLSIPDTTTGGDTAYYSFHSVKIMARASLDIGALLNIDAIAPGDFKLYAEGALLGVKNYPYYYNKMSERMPVMAGINIPTFKLLDKLSFEMEYHKSRFKDDLEKPLNGKLPIPMVAGADGEPVATFDTTFSTYTRDDVKWAVYARRHIIEGISVVGQVACDHFRPFSSLAAPSNFPVTDRIGYWYYVLRLEVGI